MDKNPTPVIAPRSPDAISSTFSHLYMFAIEARNAWYRREGAVQRVAAPVISVGNITTGGVGKTPLVIEIAARLAALRRRPAILTRGYGGRPGRPADEVRELELSLPHTPILVGANRLRSARCALSEQVCDCFVMDDGFQHRRLHRDLDLVVIDALNPWGGGFVLPAGKLREPLHNLARAHAFIISRANQAAADELVRIEFTLRGHAPQRPIFRARVSPDALVGADGRRWTIDALGPLRILPVCGLGNPATFLRLLERHAPRAAPAMIFSDHHPYDADDVTRIVVAARRHAVEAVVVTRKDWVKLEPLWRPTEPGAALPALLRLDVRLALDDPEGAFDRLLSDAVTPAPAGPGRV